MAWRSFVDRRQVDLAVVLLGEERLPLLRRPLLGRRGHEVERLLPFVERTRGVEHGSGDFAQEGGRPVDLERLVGDGDDIVALAELDDVAVALAAVLDQLVGRMVSATDRRRDRRHRPRVGRVLAAIALRRGEWLDGDPLAPDLAGDADHLGPNRGVLDACLGHDLGAGHVGTDRVAQLLGE